MRVEQEKKGHAAKKLSALNTQLQLKIPPFTFINLFLHFVFFCYKNQFFFV